MMQQNKNLVNFLNTKVEEYNQPAFIKDDPICIPHLFTKKQDIEIAGFFAATFAWGNRTTIINKSKELMQLMNMQPYEFVLHHSDNDLKSLLNFKHRTFNATDLLYFIEFFRFHYTNNKSLETAFTKWGDDVEQMLTGFHHYFFSLEHVPNRTKKHVATPYKKSNCKRLNMFLRWMVRKDSKGVDFGIWKSIHSSQLCLPLDLHTGNVSRKLGLLTRTQNDWQAVEEITTVLRSFDKKDPIKYDFSLFGLGAFEGFR